MKVYTENPWERSIKSGFVSIGTHELYVSATGKVRSRGSPVIIYLTGAGLPVAAHPTLQKALGIFARTYFYDRSGYDTSEHTPIAHPTATDEAAELTKLLHALEVAPPYILVAHSYGAIIAREFLHSHTARNVMGMVLVDSATELLYQVYPELPHPDFSAIVADIDLEEITHLREESGYTDEEWKTMQKAVRRSEEAAEKEDVRRSGLTLARKKQFEAQAFGQGALSVIRCNSVEDYRAWYEAGVKAGNGSEEQRAGAREFIEKRDLFDDELRSAQLRLSSRSRYLPVPDCGHDIVIRRPAVVANEVKWVLESLTTKET